MFRRLRHLGQAFLLLTFAAVIIFLCGWRDAQPASLQSPSPVVLQESHTKIQAQDLAVNNRSFPGEQEAVPLDAMKNDLLHRPPLDVALIFSHAQDNWSLQNQLRVAAGSLLARSSAPLRLHLITDEDGFHTATKIINDVQATNQLDSRHIKLVYVSADDFIPKIKSLVTVLKKFFTHQTNSYYSDALFYISLHLHHLLPDLERVILLDIDIKVKGDVAELHSHFERFATSNVIGLAPELSPYNHHKLSIYRRNHPNTTLGRPRSEGGFPGFNTGVVLFDLNKLRESKIIKSYLKRSKLVERSQHYNFSGDVGDQDLYSLIAFDHPDVFYTLPCGWNRQLCRYWNNFGYKAVFELFYNCSEEIKILHGNCKTPIPDNL